MRTVTVGQTFGKIFRTLKKIAVSDRKVFFFLIGFFLYIDGVGTIIDNCINIGTDLNLNTVGQVVFLLATQVILHRTTVTQMKLLQMKLLISFIIRKVLFLSVKKMAHSTQEDSCSLNGL